jgi:hypothetical protein
MIDILSRILAVLQVQPEVVLKPLQIKIALSLHLGLAGNGSRA